MIVIEGPDASGKSTLAKYLAQALSAPIRSSEGPPKFPGDIAQRVRRYAELPHNTIFDRHPVVSEEVYAFALRRPIDLPVKLVSNFYAQKPFIIYCAPTSNFQHVVKDHDTAEHLLALHENYQRLVDTYESWALTHATMIYRIGDDMSRVAHYATDYVRDIRDFHIKFAIDYDDVPRALPQDLKQFRVRFLVEELCEYANLDSVSRLLIQNAFYDKAQPTTLEEEFDALIDLVYVALGTAHLHGFPFLEGWARVQNANMAKVRTPSAAESKRGHSFDVIKPLGWRPPDLSDLVRGSDPPPSPCSPDPRQSPGDVLSPRASSSGDTPTLPNPFDP